MNNLIFTGKIGFINESSYKNVHSVEVIFLESVGDKTNYFPCVIPIKIFEEFEDYIKKGTVLQVRAHISSKLIFKNSVPTIEQKIIVDELAYLTFSDEYEPNIERIGRAIFINNNIDIDIPF